ncbi:MAG TPA: nucleotidyltransferase domain-containing protein [Methanomicrobia archaeon]|nr:nucleotidyltransferase domain-containing protein [Methanomicrobia archaeon]
MDDELTAQDKKLVEYFLSQEQVKLAYRFGSLVAGRAGPLSDSDLGVLLDDSLSKRARFKLHLKLLDDLTAILRTDKIDLVIMNGAPLSLTYEIIKANYPLLVRDRSEKIAFEHGILSRYLDRRYYETRWTVLYLKGVAEGSI